MSTETDETRIEQDIEHGEEWSSDEAAAAQEEMMADPPGPQGESVAPAEAWIAGKDVLAPHTPETPVTGEDGPDDGDVVDSFSAPRQSPDPDPFFPDGTVAAAYSGQNAAADQHHGGRPLIADEAKDAFLSRWTEIQVSFVDDPATATENAYALTEEIGTALLGSFADRSSELADDWRAASDTEQLRLVLKQYRSLLGVILPR
jgi:hypothetical protein